MPDFSIYESNGRLNKGGSCEREIHDSRKKVIDVLLITDEKFFPKNLAAGLRLRTGEFSIVVAESVQRAIALLGAAMVDVIVLALGGSDMNDSELLRHLQQLQQSQPGLKIIILSDHDLISAQVKLDNLRFSRLPRDSGELAQTILEAAQAVPRRVRGFR
jgi:DNA-binding NarL/FixJ family response regulator